MSVVSLFSGCGGMDLGFINAGFNIIWANDFDRFAVESYRHNIGNHIVHGDINNIPIEEIPPHRVLIGGFPCQPFSMMGNQNGFIDNTRGTLFFNIARIMEEYQPDVAVLENVRNLRNHDNGNTLTVIINTLNSIGYTVYEDVLNSSNFGVPHTRNRLFLVCIRNDIVQQLQAQGVRYTFPVGQPIDEEEINLQSILETNVEPKYYLSERILPTILAHGTGGYYSRSEIDLRIARPLTATMAKMHRANQDNYVTQPSEAARSLGKTDVRRLTPRECARLQGFPDEYDFVVSDSQLYKQFGNAVTVNVAEQIALSIQNIIPNITEPNPINVGV